MHRNATLENTYSVAGVSNRGVRRLGGDQGVGIGAGLDLAALILIDHTTGGCDCRVPLQRQLDDAIELERGHRILRLCRGGHQRSTCRHHHSYQYDIVPKLSRHMQPPADSRCSNLIDSECETDRRRCTNSVTSGDGTGGKPEGWKEGSRSSRQGKGLTYTLTHSLEKRRLRPASLAVNRPLNPPPHLRHRDCRLDWPHCRHSQHVGSRQTI